MDICSIYIISNNVNAKVYIGQTWNSIEERFADHVKPSSKACLKLFRAFNKINRINFNIKCLAQTTSQENADFLEKYFITKFDSIGAGSNIRDGGSNGKLSLTTRRKISESLLGNKNPLGYRHTEETKFRMKIAQNAKDKEMANAKNRLSHLGKSTALKGKTWKLIEGKRVWLTEDTGQGLNPV